MLRKCAKCKQMKDCHEHHIAHRRYSDEVVYMCFVCHRWTHDNPGQAYEEGLLQKHNISYKITVKEPKAKKCLHTKTLLDKKLGYIRCQFCGKEVPTMNYGSSKSTKKNTLNKTN